MSVESAKKFLKVLGADSGFAAKVKQAKNLEETKRIINAAGFEFSEKDLAEAQQGELKDEELDAVAGGCYVCVADVHGN